MLVGFYFFLRITIHVQCIICISYVVMCIPWLVSLPGSSVAMLLGNVRACPWPATPKPLTCHTQILDLPHRNLLPAACGRSHVPCVAGEPATCVLDMMCFYFNIGNISISSKFQFSISCGFLLSQDVFLFLEVVFLFLVLFSLPFACFYVCWFQ